MRDPSTWRALLQPTLKNNFSTEAFDMNNYVVQIIVGDEDEAGEP